MDVIEVDEKYRNLAEYYWAMYLLQKMKRRLTNSNGAVVLEKHGKYVKGKYSLTGGSVGLFEGKKIGRAKNLEKLAEEIAAQEVVVNELESDYPGKTQ